MNNKVIKSFLLRHKKGPVCPDYGRLYEEYFYINQEPPANKERCFLHCFAYGEAVWHGNYKYSRSYDVFKNYKYGDENWSFGMLLEGDGIFTSDKARYKVKPQDIIIMTPGKQVSFKTGPSRFLRKRTLILKSPLLKYICGNGALTGVDYIQSADSSRLISIYDKIKTIILTQETFWRQEISNACYEFLNELNRMAKPQHYPAALHTALNIIEANPFREYSLASLSAECKVSTSTLSRLFKKYLNSSPVDYIISLRLKQVQRLLSISDMSLKEIAAECGYKSQTFLSRAFKKKFGMSPSQFRNK
jgi:AraC-like DNA-binding protein